MADNSDSAVAETELLIFLLGFHLPLLSITVDITIIVPSLRTVTWMSSV